MAAPTSEWMTNVALDLARRYGFEQVTIRQDTNTLTSNITVNSKKGHVYGLSIKDTAPIDEIERLMAQVRDTDDKASTVPPNSYQYQFTPAAPTDYNGGGLTALRSATAVAIQQPRAQQRPTIDLRYHAIETEDDVRELIQRAEAKTNDISYIVMTMEQFGTLKRIGVLDDIVQPRIMGCPYPIMVMEQD